MLISFLEYCYYWCNFPFRWQLSCFDGCIKMMESGIAIDGAMSCRTRWCILSGPGDLLNFNLKSVALIVYGNIYIYIIELFLKGSSGKLWERISWFWGENTAEIFLKKVYFLLVIFSIRHVTVLIFLEVRYTGCFFFILDCEYLHNDLGFVLICLAMFFSIIFLPLCVRRHIWFLGLLYVSLSSSDANSLRILLQNLVFFSFLRFSELRGIEHFFECLSSIFNIFLGTHSASAFINLFLI